ncbi:hypothetical protein CVT25_003022 [Psilocybe cyanescens]|uniref:SEC7 domain-containing protein n=1 Tax=Psilocybe cyanescens TaxID=93625 RepID=A0A409WN83_PSICY|nr:hypothetical protein CVT25_003022 [Psilocybe cyanescens]
MTVRLIFATQSIMADQETHSSRAEQRMQAVARLKRAASLPRMKDGRRPPMHVEAVSEGEKPQSEEEKAVTDEEGTKNAREPASEQQELEVVQIQGDEQEKTPEPDSDHPPQPTDKTTDVELEADTELEERPLSPTAVFKKRRTRSRSRSRGSKDFKAKIKAAQSLVTQVGGDSSPDENPSSQAPVIHPMPPPLLSPVPLFPFLQQSGFLRSPAAASPDMSLFYPGTSPPTPLPTLEDLRGLMRSNSAGSSAAGRRMAMHKLTGGTETYDPSPSPTPPSSISKLSRNNTVSGGERIAARQNMLSRLGTRITKEADADGASGAEDRGAPSPTPKRRRRRSRRASATPSSNPTVSDSDFNSTNPNTPALPSTPLPTLRGHFAELRAQSTTPNQHSSSRTESSERITDATPPPLPPTVLKQVEDEPEPERPEHTRRRSVLIEDPDEEDRDPPDKRFATSPLPGTPQRTFQNIEGLRIHHSSDTPSNGSSDSGPTLGVGVPIFLSQRAPSRNEMFPSSPFMTPLKEKSLNDEDEEQVLYPASSVRPRTPYATISETYDREISWIASPVPEIRMPIDDDEEEEDDLEQEVNVQVEAEEEAPLSSTSSNGFSPEAYDNDDRTSSSSKSVLVESETSPENVYVPASPSSVGLALQPPTEEAGSPQFFPTRLSVASQRSPHHTDFSEWEERYSGNDPTKRTEPASATTWEKVKSTFSRAGSSTGRRSRTNSIVTRERRDHTDSSISRESGASLISAKTDKGENGGPATQPQAPPLMQSPSASTSILSLAPHAPPRSSVSPIPPPSSADMSKYQNAKLFPFPGMLRLEEERRQKGQLPSSASTPDVSMQSNAYEESQTSYSYSNTPIQSPDLNRERKLSHQNSDSLAARYGAESSSTSPASPHHPEYMDVSPSPQQNGSGTGYNLKLPTTLPGVKQWLSKNSKKKPVIPSGTVPGSVSFSPLPVIESPSLQITNKKPSISDIFGKKANETSDWEEPGNAPSTPNGEIVTVTPSVQPSANGVTLNGSNLPAPEADTNFKGRDLVPLDLVAGRGSPYKFPHEPISLPRLATPDPSSLSDYPPPTASESSSTSSSQYSLKVPQGLVVLERLEENLARGSRSPLWTSAIDDPPRKLILSSPVLQVVNPNTVKDRFLFLFNDVLVIAKPVTYDQDNLMDTYKLSLPDRKYTVKSVVQLRNLRFCADRSEAQGKAPSLGRNPLIRSFISHFAKDPDHAISTLFTKSNAPDDPVLLGQLLSRILELDRSRLGEYLARKTSKSVLKTYLDGFGFAGLRIDVALRVFLLSVNVSGYSHSYGALEHLLDSFSSRWYEANAKFVAHDKDMAVRLVWALVQLNDRLHGGIADEPGPTDHIRRNVTSKEFLDAFRRYDIRYLITDDLLLELYKSIYHEHLCQAYPTTFGSLQDTPITIKRPLPTRLTYKVQSDPIVFRLPQADPLLSIELYGQDIEFEPSVLQFAKSSEASFRVTGKSLGSKTITMCRSGPNAVRYSGIPLSHTIVVERAFMRNTFQLAFAQSGTKRKYMFSVDDPIIRNEWATSLRRHIEFSTNSAQAPSGLSSAGYPNFHKAADAVAFRVLQETLIGTGSSTNAHRTNGSMSTQSSSINSHLNTSSVSYTNPLQTRSKSRSRVYHRHGAGKNELDLDQRSPSTSYDSNDHSPESSDQANTPDQRSDGVLWTARDLEIHCQQNSSISLVLSFLQVGAPESPPVQ